MGEDAQKELMERMRDSLIQIPLEKIRNRICLVVYVGKRKIRKKIRKKKAYLQFLVRRGEGGKLDIRPKTNKRKNKKKLPIKMMDLIRTCFRRNFK